jgi:hypothetical protein
MMSVKLFFFFESCRTCTVELARQRGFLLGRKEAKSVWRFSWEEEGKQLKRKKEKKKGEKYEPEPWRRSVRQLQWEQDDWACWEAIVGTAQWPIRWFRCPTVFFFACEEKHNTKRRKMKGKTRNEPPLADQNPVQETPSQHERGQDCWAWLLHSCPAGKSYEG